MRKKKRLKTFVISTAYALGVTVLFITILFVGSRAKLKDLSTKKTVDKPVTKEVVPVINIENQTISKPFNNEGVTISKYFYNKDADDTSKESSIIYYENTYMQNTGVLYSSDEQFDVLACLPGTVTNVKDDEILGKVVYVEYNTNLTVVYYSLESTELKIGDQIEQDAVIGKSGTNKLENEKKYSLLIEVYLKGNLINPLDFYEMNIEEINS